MAFTCFTCQQPGHLAKDCPNTAYLAGDMAGDSRPMWCGTCDERSRHLELADGRVRRCQCHPESHKMLAQHRRCPSCKVLVVSWDTAPCGQHSLAATARPYVGPSVKIAAPDNADQLRQLAARQVAENRLARIAFAEPGN